MTTVTVRINGTAENRWNRLGLTANPFPQTAKAEHAALDWALRQLDSDPIPTTEALLERLALIKERTGADGPSWTQFANAIVANYREGELTAFELTIGGQ